MSDDKLKDKWHQIWSSKTLLNSSKIKLEDLIKLNGFNTGVGDYNVETWTALIDDFSERVGLTNNKNILEIGCGCGAFLYACENKVKANYFGIDYSKSLIDTARKVMPNSKFEVGRANSDFFKSTYFDVIVSHSVFHYFPSIDYAYDVIKIAYKKLNKNGYLCLLDLNDSLFETIYHMDRKLNYKNPKTYEETYKGLDHLFFEKSDIKSFMKSIGFERIKFFPHASEKYGNSKYRFNLLAIKTKN